MSRNPVQRRVKKEPCLSMSRGHSSPQAPHVIQLPRPAADRASTYTKRGVLTQLVAALCLGLTGADAAHPPTRVTTHQSNDYHPKWSPDGSTIAFTSHRGGKIGLWTTSATGGAAKEIVTGLDGDFHIAWSPDGSTIAFDARGSAGAPDIWIIAIDGGKPRQLTKWRGGDSHPAWSPDGSTIAFTSGRSGNDDIWTIPAAGGTPRQITTHTESDWHPRWSLDGSRILFTSGRSGNSDLWTIPGRGGVAIQLTRHEALDDCAEWSPDGSTIVFVSERSGDREVWRIPALGGVATAVTSSGGQDGWPAWSPDGLQIAFNSTRSGNLDLWVVDVAAVTTESMGSDWPQWGGPNRNFTVEASGLADKWPEDGPKKLWHRTLGTGYSSIVADDGVLFTMYREEKADSHEHTIALDAATGETIWRKSNLATIPRDTAGHGKEHTGPNATPLIVGDRLYTVGRNATLHCFNKSDGTVLWNQELQGEFGAQIETCGYSCSPLAYGTMIILPLGHAEDDKRKGNSLVALDQLTGDVVWRTQTFRVDHSSPILITFGGKDQYVLCMKDGVIGVDPADGTLLWKQVFPEEEFRQVRATPVWDGRDTLLFSSRGVGYAIQLTKKEGKTFAEPLWSNHKLAMGMGTPVLVGDMLVGSKRGPDAASPMLGVDVSTGKRLWLERMLPAMVLRAGDDKLVFLEQNGQLGLATVTRSGLTIHSRYEIAGTPSFTVPTLVGTMLYVRDEEHIMAIDLGD